MKDVGVEQGDVGQGSLLVDAELICLLARIPQHPTSIGAALCPETKGVLDRDAAMGPHHLVRHPPALEQPDEVRAGDVEQLGGLTRREHAREDRVSKSGNVTVRCLSRLRHIGVGRVYEGERVKLLIANDRVRVVRADGTLPRELVIDAARDYQPRLSSSSIS